MRNNLNILGEVVRPLLRPTSARLHHTPSGPGPSAQGSGHGAGVGDVGASAAGRGWSAPMQGAGFSRNFHLEICDAPKPPALASEVRLIAFMRRQHVCG